VTRKASAILKAIREQVFGYSQKGFAQSLGYSREETICRLESGQPKFRLNSTHLDKLRRLRPHPDKAEAFEALLKEFEAALSAETPPGVHATERTADTEALHKVDEGIRQAQGAARQAAEAVRLAAQLHELAEARRAEEAQRAEQLRQAEEARRAEEAQRAEQLRQADEARRAEEAQRAEQLRQADEARRAEEAQRAEQLRQADEARRAEDARERAEAKRHTAEEVRQAQGAAREATDAARLAKQNAEVAQQVSSAAMKLIRQSRYVTVALALVVSPIVSTTVVRYTDARREHETDTLAHEEKPDPKPRHPEEPPQQTAPDEEADTAALDGGTALTEALLQALPLPPGGVPGQRAAPCPAVYEEIHGRCWQKYTLSAEQVRVGSCEQLRLYEPEPGWCRSHRYGYLPVFASRKDNNSVEPE